MPILLAALLACLTLTTIAAAQETTESQLDERTELLFRVGLTALAVAERTGDEAERSQMYDEAIEAFRTILVNRPDLVRVRLELARTFFLKEQDGLARRHFEAVLAGRGAAARRRQHPAVPRRHASPQAPDRAISAPPSRRTAT